MDFSDTISQYIDDWQALLNSNYGDVDLDRFMDRLATTFGEDRFYKQCLGYIDAQDYSKYMILNYDQVFNVLSRQTNPKYQHHVLDDHESMYYANLLSDWYDQSDSFDRREWYMMYWDGNNRIVAIRALRSRDVTALLYRLSH